MSHLTRQEKIEGDPELVRSLKGPVDWINCIRFNWNMKQIGSVDKAGIALIYDFRGDMRPYRYDFSGQPSNKNKNRINNNNNNSNNKNISPAL